MNNVALPYPLPRHCGTCRRMLARARNRRPVRRSVDVQTWCRICGKPALLNLLLDYPRAVRHLQTLHQQVMTHEVGNHFEHGGWGRHWRLDHVLAKVFPADYADDPRRPFWPQLLEGLAEDRPIVIVHAVGFALLSPDARESSRRRLEEGINARPRSRVEIRAIEGECWNEEELELEFDVTGYVAPFVCVVRRDDGLMGTMLFQRNPRLYWGFDPGRLI